MKAETLFKNLKSEAHESCRFRKHHMAPFKRTRTDLDRLSACSECRHCGMQVFVDTRPEPNSIDIGGEAVALNCSR